MKRAIELVSLWENRQLLNHEENVVIANEMAILLMQMSVRMLAYERTEKAKTIEVNHQVANTKVNAIFTALSAINFGVGKMKTPRKHADLIKQLADDDSLDIECFTVDGKWAAASYGALFNFPDNEFRIKPTKPSIDWSHLGDEFVQISVDGNGEGFAFTAGRVKIELDNTWFSCITDGMKYANLNGFKSFKPGTCDWKDSLVMRPEGE